MNVHCQIDGHCLIFFIFCHLVLVNSATVQCFYDVMVKKWNFVWLCNKSSKISGVAIVAMKILNKRLTRDINTPWEPRNHPIGSLVNSLYPGCHQTNNEPER